MKEMIQMTQIPNMKEVEEVKVKRNERKWDKPWSHVDEEYEALQ